MGSYHDAHVVSEEPKCTCCNAGNEKVELEARRAQVRGVSGQWEDGHPCKVHSKRNLGILLIRGKCDL